jgi:predicted enzyme related to lactoylglutathione lyase
MQNKFFWYDVMTTDTAAAARFYTDVVEWGTQPQGTSPEYTLFTVQGQGVAGLMAIPDEVAGHGGRPQWLGYVWVEDVDSAIVKLKQLGGTVHREPFTVPDTIRFAVVADPQGAAFHIATPLPRSAATELPVNAPGTIGWRELYAADWSAAFDFYQKMFGWTKAEAIDMGPMGTYQLFASGAEPVGGMMTKPPAVPTPHWGFYFNVAAIDAAVGRVERAGGTVSMGPQQVPGGQWVLQCTDPQGASFALVAPQR